MDWIEALNEIRNAKDNNRLVIFVGAGVSRNSGVPDWNELVELYADKIDTENVEEETDEAVDEAVGDEKEANIKIIAETFGVEDVELLF